MFPVSKASSMREAPWRTSRASRSCHFGIGRQRGGALHRAQRAGGQRRKAAGSGCVASPGSGWFHSPRATGPRPCLAPTPFSFSVCSQAPARRRSRSDAPPAASAWAGVSK
jgi:hypothetical protein